jgi:hypothetical protein
MPDLTGLIGVEDTMRHIADSMAASMATPDFAELTGLTDATRRMTETMTAAMPDLTGLIGVDDTLRRFAESMTVAMPDLTQITGMEHTFHRITETVTTAMPVLSQLSGMPEAAFLAGVTAAGFPVFQPSADWSDGDRASLAFLVELTVALVVALLTVSWYLTEANRTGQVLAEESTAGLAFDGAQILTWAINAYVATRWLRQRLV